MWLTKRARGWRVQCAWRVAPKPSFTSTLQELIKFRGFCKSIKIAKFCAVLVLLQALKSLMSYFFCSIGLFICSCAITHIWLWPWPRRIFWKLVFLKLFKSNLAIHGPLFSHMHFRIGLLSFSKTTGILIGIAAPWFTDNDMCQEQRVDSPWTARRRGSPTKLADTKLVSTNWGNFYAAVFRKYESSEITLDSSEKTIRYLGINVTRSTLDLHRAHWTS